MIHPALLEKYNVPGPRYTSYPTVPYWERNPTTEEWLDSLRTALQSSEGAAIYVHIPFCESLCTYCGCNNRITRNRSVGMPYVQTLLKEFALYRERLQTCVKIPLGELHLGGGTPTFLAPDELAVLLRGILDHCTPVNDHEFSVEVDPRVTSGEHLALLREFGFRRISLGIQDFDPKVQEIVHRIQSVEQVRTVTAEARKLGFDSVNYDLIYGLPFQTVESVEGTIRHVSALRPDRIAFYSYAHVPWIRAGQRRFTELDLPDGAEKRRLYERGRELLEQEGYVEIGMDHFSLKSDALHTATLAGGLHRNFMGYTARHVNPILALGVSAIGDAWTVFAQNEKLLETYCERVERGEIPVSRGHVLNPEDLVLRKHILNLMTRMETSWETAEMRTPYLETVPSRLSELEKDGLIRISENRCTVLESGRPFLRNICMAFDARLERKAPGIRLFSSTV